MKSAALKLLYRVLDPVVNLLNKMGVTPNGITFFSLILAIGGTALFVMGHSLYALIVLWLAGCCDVLDGRLARTTNQATPAGAFFDSFIDRFSDGVFILGFAYIGHLHSFTLMMASLVSVLAAFSVSYARARGESLGADVRSGPMTRTARYGFLMCLVGGHGALKTNSFDSSIQLLEVGMIVFSVITLFTALLRAHLTMRKLQAS